MPEIQKPSDLSVIWADAGDKIKPDNSKIQTGWLAEIPTRQNFNWLDGRQDQFNAHVNQHGVPSHDLTTEYIGGKSYAQGSDGEVYFCIQTNTEKDPVADNGTYWKATGMNPVLNTGAKRFVGYEVFSTNFTAVVNHKYFLTAPATATLPAGVDGDSVVVAKLSNITATAVDSLSNVYSLADDETTFVFISGNWTKLSTGSGSGHSVSLSGPVTVIQGSTNTYTITDYNAFSIYSTSTSVGTFTRTGDTISLVVPNPANTTQITLTVVRDGLTTSFLVAVGAQSVATPSITYPAEGQTNIEVAPTLTSSVFTTIPAGQDTHQSSQWQIASDSGFTSIIYDSGVTTTNKTSVQVPAGTLSLGTVYYTRVRYIGAIIGNSAYSATRIFTTSNQSVITPVVSVSGGPTDVGETPTISTSAFAVSSGTDSHVSTDWQILKVSDNSVVWQSLGNTINKTSIIVPSGILVVGTQYKARVRFSGAAAGNSAYGEYTFTTKSIFFVFDPSSTGLPYGGGYYAGANIVVAGTEYALVVAPKTLGGENSGVAVAVSTNTALSPNTRNDGVGNSSPLIANNSLAAIWADNLNIGGYTDWYLPSVDEMEIIYRYLKPTTGTNAVTGNSPYGDPNGINSNSVPVGNQYTTTNPTQTVAVPFKVGGTEALTPTSYYWTSSRDAHYVGNRFYALYPATGNMQGDLTGSSLWYARAVRRVPIPV